jgi:hypothetical protein
MSERRNVELQQRPPPPLDPSHQACPVEHLHVVRHQRMRPPDPALEVRQAQARLAVLEGAEPGSRGVGKDLEDAKPERFANGTETPEELVGRECVHGPF